MAQTKKKRPRKHRGTQAGTIEARGRTGRPQTAAEAKQIRRDRRAERMSTPPTWKSAFNRSVLSALAFGVLTILVFGWSIGQALPVAAALVFLYLPFSYVTDRWFYNRRQRRAAAGR
ncbi:MAG: hypothetical protein M3340_19280 [Actinomycetota bacterium]|nr:hypothetical protein [Actinomycetota bacterium]